MDYTHFSMTMQQIKRMHKHAIIELDMFASNCDFGKCDYLVHITRDYIEHKRTMLNARTRLQRLELIKMYLAEYRSDTLPHVRLYERICNAYDNAINDYKHASFLSRNYTKHFDIVHSRYMYEYNGEKSANHTIDSGFRRNSYAHIDVVHNIAVDYASTFIDDMYKYDANVMYIYDVYNHAMCIRRENYELYMDMD